MKLSSLFSAALAIFSIAPGCSSAHTPEPEPQVAASHGTVVPDFEAVDENGVHFKLSEYRGKVVVLDFWGIW